MGKLTQVQNTEGRLPKVDLGFYPTPLHRLQRLSGQLGVEIYLKREDLSGFSPFGGNKIRKLEYLLGDALAKDCDHVVTFGATQSNHAMQTVAACRKYGLFPHLFLRRVVAEDTELRANLLIEHIMGADVHVADSREKAEQQAKEAVKQLEAKGHRCYVIPGGGSNAVGAVGFIDSFCEISEQLSGTSGNSYLFLATGSGGTLAGLLAGKKILDSPIEIISVAVGEKEDTYAAKVAELATDALDRAGFRFSLSEEAVRIDYGFYFPGYEQPNEAAAAAIRLLAETEGILLDPVYTGKAFAGLLQYIRDGVVPQGSTVVFLHTGGTLALFAEKKITGKI